MLPLRQSPGSREGEAFDTVLTTHARRYKGRPASCQVGGMSLLPSIHM